MILRYLQEYVRLVESEMAPPFLCPIDEKFGIIVLNVDKNDVPFFFCIVCNSKISIGESTYQAIVNELRKRNPQHDFTK
ncbi:hypothetical protein UFOVP1491_57 [uncultured Caudovirales phage]|uniref:Uncharacterized protein n=1 Tax=uncultured Caudovirales phage TaxID=2100421 RepID=A0A6J5QE10_9CAUD|nr:hypothetical protein UFOVP485_64 [uncultured Caudovirales phage]CAB4150708.1 hypothetical protein UFOVP575_16 [uncultured Caudovirales phage]CAB4175285.1 hypothetical protein UFOVP963_144 [uncultured Caudovirales phage]CAB4179701.1 hypothetical protein UFOVP1032_57 [uncultured Caudovirales phage]CAB4185830.1 hypothetical protein UFOVP1125_125 [uncultured Caudovirales phage]